jgi:periplasmic protein TonB
MSSISVIDQLDDAIGILLMDADTPLPHADADISEMIALAAELRAVPSPEFRAQLKAELMQEAVGNRVITLAVPAEQKSIHEPISLPTLFAGGLDTAPIPPARMALSFLMHAAAAALIATSGLWMVQHRDAVKVMSTNLVTNLSEYALPAAPTRSGGGGGGGDHDKLAASQGSLPKFSREQVAPPMVVIRNENSALVVPPTVVAPPDMKLPQFVPLGDPMARISGPPSNGIGGGGGIGSGTSGGVGPGHGPGAGDGSGGGIGGGPYMPGGGVSAPRTIYAPDPEFSDEARKARHQGTVQLWAIITPDGRAVNISVSRSLGMGLDEKAIEAVKTWRFEPAKKDGHPVAAQVSIEVNFHLY